MTKKASVETILAFRGAARSLVGRDRIRLLKAVSRYGKIKRSSFAQPFLPTRLSAHRFLERQGRK